MNDFFTWVFLGEMTIKLIALSPKLYAKDNMNIFDGSIVIISLIDYGTKYAVFCHKNDQIIRFPITKSFL